MGAEGKFDLKLSPGYEPELGGGVGSGPARVVFTSPPTTTATTASGTGKPERPGARPLTGRKAASTPSIPDTVTTCKPLMESFEQTVSADNLSSGAGGGAGAGQLTEGGREENLAAEAVAASVLSSVLTGETVSSLPGQPESPNDNDSVLSPLLEVVDNLETEEREMFGPAASNLNLRGETGQATARNNTDNRSSGLDVVSLASSLASDLAHLVESMNLADRPGQASNANRNRPLTAR